jgi:flagellar motor switch protein FliM
MAEILSQDAIDKLILLKSESGEAAGPPLETPEAKQKITVYDFKRPDKFSKDQIRTVAIMHETLLKCRPSSRRSFRSRACPCR